MKPSTKRLLHIVVAFVLITAAGFALIFLGIRLNQLAAQDNPSSYTSFWNRQKYFFQVKKEKVS